MISYASHLDTFKLSSIKKVAFAVKIVIFKEPMICRSSHLLEIGRHLQPQVHSFFFLRILDGPRFSNWPQKRLFVARGGHDAFVLDACQRAAFLDPMGVLCRC